MPRLWLWLKRPLGNSSLFYLLCYSLHFNKLLPALAAFGQKKNCSNFDISYDANLTDEIFRGPFFLRRVLFVSTCITEHISSILTKLSQMLARVFMCTTSDMISCWGIRASTDDRLLVKILDSLEFIARRSFSDIWTGSCASSTCKACQLGRDLIIETRLLYNI